MAELKNYQSEQTAWCPGCGNFGILNAIKKALFTLQIEPHKVIIASGIGQAAKLPHYIKCHVLNGLHGRALPLATGAKLANHQGLVLVFTGDGDCYGEGGNHLLHTIRRNINIKVFVHNNQVYGLTKGQASPTSDEGFVTKVQPHGVMVEPFHPLSMAISLEASFVARGFSGEIEHLSFLIQEAIKHKGFSLIDILQPCVSFNKKNTHAWYKSHIYDVNKEGGYNPEDKTAAFLKSQEWEPKIPIGIIYKKNKPTFEEKSDVLKDTVLVEQKINLESLPKVIKDFR